MIAEALPSPATVVNKGVAGHRMYDLEARWTTDVLALTPSAVTVLIGINDTWRRYDRGLLSPVPEFEASLDRVLTLTGEKGGLRLDTPDAIRRGLSRYPEVVSASTVTGDADVVVQVFASDMRHFERVLERIAGEPFVERTKSVLVLSPLLRRFSSGSPA